LGNVILFRKTPEVEGRNSSPSLARIMTDEPTSASAFSIIKICIRWWRGEGEDFCTYHIWMDGWHWDWEERKRIHLTFTQKNKIAEKGGKGNDNFTAGSHKSDKFMNILRSGYRPSNLQSHNFCIFSMILSSIKEMESSSSSSSSRR
jgi:hypothetical protein